MRLGLISSAWVQVGRDMLEGIRLTKEIGFDSIDLFLEPLELDVQTKWAIKRACDDVGLPIVSLPCVAVGLIDFNRPVRKFHLERVRRYLELAYEYEAHNVLLVLGEYIWEQQVIAPEDQWQWAVEGLRELGDYGQQLGVKIAIELEPFRYSLINNIDAMDQFLRDVDNPMVQANIDISHMVLSGTPPEALNALKGRACHVHISDCDGKVHGDLPPGRGVVPFVPYLREIRALGIDGAISIELEYCPEPDRIVDWVREAYEATDRLLQQAGIERG